jgi:hypothetical protein
MGDPSAKYYTLIYYTTIVHIRSSRIYSCV